MLLLRRAHPPHDCLTKLGTFILKSVFLGDDALPCCASLYMVSLYSCFQMAPKASRSPKRGFCRAARCNAITKGIRVKGVGPAHLAEPG